MMAKEKTSRARPASLAYEEEDGTQREGRASTEADTGVNPRGPTTIIQGISNAERRNAESDEGASNAKDKQSKSCMCVLHQQSSASPTPDPIRSPSPPRSRHTATKAAQPARWLASPAVRLARTTHALAHPWYLCLALNPVWPI